MQFHIDCRLEYQVEADTTVILNVEAQRGGRQRIHREQFATGNGLASESHEMPETGNRYRRLILPPGQHSFTYSADVETMPARAEVDSVSAVPVDQLPFDVLPHLFPSRYCPSDLMARFAWRQFGEVASGHEQVEAICNWIFDNVDYQGGSSDSSTSAHDTFTTRAGVCRDFAHLGITFARALGIPARFVSAYALELVPQDFHAVFEAWLDGGWYLFDATRLCPIDGLVKIAVGRDAADSAFLTSFGNMSGPPKHISITRSDSAPAAEWPIDAVSLSAR